jgi:hypothetical protein
MLIEQSTHLDYFKLLIDDKFVENPAACSQLYTITNMPEAQKSLTPQHDQDQPGHHVCDALLDPLQQGHVL